MWGSFARRTGVLRGRRVTHQQNSVRNPAIASARSVIEQNEGRQIQAGAYPNPTIGGQTANASLRDPSTGSPITESVSYTHLRAHETGRNLVCRLLLEK